MCIRRALAKRALPAGYYARVIAHRTKVEIAKAAFLLLQPPTTYHPQLPEDAGFTAADRTSIALWAEEASSRRSIQMFLLLNQTSTASTAFIIITAATTTTTSKVPARCTANNALWL